MGLSRLKLIGVILLIVGTSLIVAGVLMLFRSDVYRSAATIQVRHPPPLPGNSSFYDPYFLLTEFEAIRSHVVLTNVIATLNLNESWGKKYYHGRRLSDSETEEMIKRRLKLQPIKNTHFIEIAVFDDDPDAAAKLANAIAESFCEYRKEEFRHLAAENNNPTEWSQFNGAQIMDRAVPKTRPLQLNNFVAAVMLCTGLLLMIAGLITFTYPEEQRLEKGAPLKVI